MKKIFVDTNDFVAVLNKRDQWHERAIEVENLIGKVQKITTELVLIEVLNYFCEFRSDIKKYVAASINRIMTNGDIEIVLFSSQQFSDGFEFYNSRLDKGYSLTDCVSMNVMREQNITQILTHDDHFEQEGFTILL